MVINFTWMLDHESWAVTVHRASAACWTW